MTVWLALCVAAWGTPDEVLIDPFLLRIYGQGRAHEEAGELRDAATSYRLVSLGDPTFAQAVLDLGRVLEQDGRLEEAEAVYQSAAYDAGAVRALGEVRLILEDGPGAAAAFRVLQDLAPAEPDVLVLRADASASVDPVASSRLLLDFLDRTGATLSERLVEVTVRVAVDLWTLGEQDEAWALIGSLEGRFPGVATGRSIPELRARFEVDELAQTLAKTAEITLASGQIARLRGAREAFAAADLSRAEALLEGLLVEEPRSAAVWATLSDVRRASGDVVGAEQAIVAATQLDPLEAEYAARHGDLLSEGFGGRHDAEAAAAYARAVQRRGGDAELWLRKAGAERRASLRALSVASARRALQLDPEVPGAAAARAMVAGAARERLPPVALPAAPGPPTGVPQTAWVAYHRAWAWWEHGQPGRAIDTLVEVREEAPGLVAAVNLEAAIRVDLGEVAAGVALYEESLQQVPDQPEVMVDLARLYGREGRGKEATLLWERAAAAGSSRALWRRAQAEVGALRWLKARRTLDDYFARATHGPSYDDALALDARLAVRTQGGLAAGAIAVLGTLGVPVWWRWRRRAGVGIEELVARAPDVAPDVARICSALRHEALKHHTSVLVPVADALDAGDPGPAQWTSERLFGSSGALARLDGYVAELGAVARRAGVHLNLRHSDPVFAPMLAAVERLRGLRGALEQGRGRRLADDLRRISEALNDQAYRGLGRLIAGLSLLPLDASKLVQIWDAVVAEPAFRDVQLPRLEVAEVRPGLLLRLYPDHLRDILANLVRNSVTASLQAGTDRVGLAVEVEEDHITGLERVAIRVRDEAPRTVSTQMIRGRYIERGLGLVVDLTSRVGGSIHVEDDPAFRKAVVVRLPRAEPPQEQS